ncbi:MAG TPA: polysaccharide deacetylase family protein [Planctomycetes bacterium]|nr:polysaccharide deacetylase family protein [Planctomycetota bacterium]
MDYLARSCKVVKPSEIMTAEAEGSKNIIAITFDDAFAGVKEHAIPVLREFGLPAGIFVPAGRLGQKSGWEVFDDFEDANGMVINEEQILELDKDGFEIFSHTYSHPVLTEVNDGRLEVELVESKNLLEGIVGHEILAISYPYGAYDARICEAAERYGYKLGFTIEPDMVCGATRCLEIGRFSVSPQDSLLKFKLKNNGAYQVAKYLRCLKKSFVKA